jgi:hypothetical protein
LNAKCVDACEASIESQSSVGCDFYAVAPHASKAGSCFAAYVTNTWNAPITITVERRGKVFDTSTFAYTPSGGGGTMTYAPLTDGKLAPGQVAILFLSATGKFGTFACPEGTGTATIVDPSPTGTGYNKAFHIRTSAPVVAYDIFPYGAGDAAVTSATLLLPTSVWGTNYVGIVPAPSGTTWLSFVAQEDGTEVTFNPAADLKGGSDVAASPKGVPQTYFLDEGDVLQLENSAELTGTPIQSTKPIGVWGGAVCMNVPSGSTACDAEHKQFPPVSALGHEYAAVRYRDRYDDKPESPPWRIIGAVDGTQLSYVPAKPAGAPDTVDLGQAVTFDEADPFVVKAQDDQHPFYLTSFMTGCSVYGAAPDCRGDPELVNTIPPEQYMSSYVFFTDPTYPETNLVVVRRKEKGAFAPVHLDCAGDLTGWQPLGEYEWTRVDLVRHNFQPQGSCDNGVHTMTSDNPFGLTVWGWGTGETGGKAGDPTAPGFYTQTVSYAYPAGARVQKITPVVVPPVPK